MRLDRFNPMAILTPREIELLKQKYSKIPMGDDRPDRDSTIMPDEITNLKITLGTTQDVNEFLALC